MQHKDTLLIRRPNHTIPEEFRKVLAEQHPTSISYSQTDPENNSMELSVFPGEEYDLLDAIQTLDNEDWRDRYVVFHLLYSDASNPADVQPYVLVKDGENALIAVFLDGDFPAYSRENRMSNAYNVVAEGIADLVKEAYQKAKGDLAETHKIMGDAAFKKTMRPYLTPRGVAIFSFADASLKPLVSQINDIHKDFTFGWTSRDLGWSEQMEKATAPAVEVPADRKLTAKEKMLLKSHGGAPPAPAKPTETKPDEKTPLRVVPEVKPEEPKKEEPKREEEEIIPVPVGLYGKAKKKWLMNNWRWPDAEGKKKLPANWASIKEFPYSQLTMSSPLRKMEKKSTDKDAVTSEAAGLVIMPQKKKDTIAFVQTKKPVDDPSKNLEEMLQLVDPFTVQLGFKNGLKDVMCMSKDTLRKIANDGSLAFPLLVECLAALDKSDPSILNPDADEDEAVDINVTADKPLKSLSAKEKMMQKAATG